MEGQRKEVKGRGRDKRERMESLVADRLAPRADTFS